MEGRTRLELRLELLRLALQPRLLPQHIRQPGNSLLLRHHRRPALKRVEHRGRFEPIRRLPKDGVPHVWHT